MTNVLHLVVRLTPRGRRDTIEGWARDEHGRPYLKVRVAAPPVDGAANDALVCLIAKALKRPRHAVKLVSGAGGRLKHLEIMGADEQDRDRAFGPAVK